MQTIEISTYQAKEIASFVYKDIAKYVSQHQKEYQKFSKQIEVEGQFNDK